MFRTILVLVCLLMVFAGGPVFGAQQTQQWSCAEAEELLGFTAGVVREGLDPADYGVERLRLALASGDTVELNAAATDTFLRLAGDLKQGHIPARNRNAWYIATPPFGEDERNALLSEALRTHDIAGRLASLLPTDREYRALKAGLAETPGSDSAATQRLRVNLERWRWMPRDMPSRYLLVNVPAFELSLVDNGKTIERYRIIVGKIGTPTPQFSATVTAIIFNPWWDVPQSIVAESVGQLVRANPAEAQAKGYVVSRSRAGIRVRQSPGPTNALGQMKLVMPNPFTIYIHDTPTRSLFEDAVRAFSHGCIRVEHALGLATTLLGGQSGWDKAAIDRVVQSRKTTRIDLDRPIPVYVGYFTASLDGSGRLASYADVYGRDEPIFAALTDREVGHPADATQRIGASECSGGS